MECNKGGTYYREAAALIAMAKEETKDAVSFVAQKLEKKKRVFVRAATEKGRRSFQVRAYPCRRREEGKERPRSEAGRRKGLKVPRGPRGMVDLFLFGWQKEGERCAISVDT